MVNKVYRIVEHQEFWNGKTGTGLMKMWEVTEKQSNEEACFSAGFSPLPTLGTHLISCHTITILSLLNLQFLGICFYVRTCSLPSFLHFWFHSCRGKSEYETTFYPKVWKKKSKTNDLVINVLVWFLFVCTFWFLLLLRFWVGFF